MHQRHRRGQPLVRQVGVVGLHLVGQEHALVDERAARQRHGVVADVAALVGVVDGVRDDLADQVELALEIVLARNRLRPADEDLPMHGLGRPHHVGQLGVGDRHRAPAQKFQALLADQPLPDALAVRAQPLVLRHEDMADRVVAGLRQLDVELGAFLDQEVVRDLDEDARAVAGDRVRTHGTAMLEVLEDVERVLDDAMRLATLQVGDEADAARVMLAQRIEQAAGLGKQLVAVLLRFPLFRTAGGVHRCRHGLAPSGLKRVALPSGVRSGHASPAPVFCAQPGARGLAFGNARSRLPPLH